MKKITSAKHLFRQLCLQNSLINYKFKKEIERTVEKGTDGKVADGQTSLFLSTDGEK